MRTRPLLGLLILGAIGLAGAARAEPCHNAPAERASVTPFGAEQEALVASAAILMQRETYSAPAIRGLASVCEGPDFTAAGGRFILRGTKSGAILRAALPADGKGALAFLTPAVDLLKTLDAQKAGRPPPPASGYLLCTSDQETISAWRLYGAVPGDAALAADMADALAGKLPPLFRFDRTTKQITVYAH